MIKKIENKSDLEIIVESMFKEFKQKETIEELSNRTIFGIYNNNELIGYAIYLLVVDTADLLNIFIFDKFKNQGYGTRLLEGSINILNKEDSIVRVYLEVKKSNEIAQTLYNRLGFKFLRNIKNYYQDEDGIALLKELSLWKY